VLSGTIFDTGVELPHRRSTSLRKSAMRTSNTWAKRSPNLEEIMRFISFGYADEKKWDSMSPEEKSAIMEDSLAYHEVLREAGHLLPDGEALQHARTAKTLRSINGEVMVTDGPFAESKEQLGGFFVFEASDMNHAIELLSKHPAVRFGNTLEIRPADEQINALVNERLWGSAEKTKRQSRSKA
jgi:hypothetical protein